MINDEAIRFCHFVCKCGIVNAYNAVGWQRKNKENKINYNIYNEISNPYNFCTGTMIVKNIVNEINKILFLKIKGTHLKV